MFQLNNVVSLVQLQNELMNEYTVVHEMLHSIVFECSCVCTIPVCVLIITVKLCAENPYVANHPLTTNGFN